MSAYQQMGHDSKNLLDEESLCDYTGAIVSPVNYTEDETRALIERVQRPAEFDFVFDPQLYYPETDRGVLRQWSYFPTDVESADQASDSWWKSLVDEIAATGSRLGVRHVCSPAIVPRTYSDDFYDRLAEVGTVLAQAVDGQTNPVQTLLVNLPELAETNRPHTIASIISRTPCRLVYLILVTDREPRRELADAGELAGAMLLISLLEKSGLRVVVGFSSSDMVLWKTAGATGCTTGKFFNLRRFTKSRFEEPAGGGGQLPYWFEESLLAYLRETDILRVRSEGMISEVSMRNPHRETIFDILDRSEGEAWLKHSWRHYMWWFADMEGRISHGEADVRHLLQQAENNWLTLEDRDVLFEEPRNNGSWIRPWRQALSDFRRMTS